MRFTPISIAGASLVEIQPATDERGFFARSFCAREFAAAGLSTSFVQASISYNQRKGTLRGMHFQWPPSRESKLVRCVRGAVHDVILDLRPDSPTYLLHEAVRLDQWNRCALFVPEGVAHGFQTLEDTTEVHYLMDDWFAPGLGDGVRWDDSAFGIHWPLPVACISDRDRTLPSFDRAAHEAALATRRSQSVSN